MNPAEFGNVLISGSSTGIGKACALYLARRGFSVLAGVRRREDGVALEQIIGAGGKLQYVLLDVADAHSIASAVEHVRELSRECGLGAVVNNAGVVVFGPAEFVSLQEWRRQFEVNFFGQIALTQPMLPILREQVARRGPGAARVVFMGSIAGRLSQPMLTPYTASKHAIEALSDGLRMELREQGIRVCVIEPGAIQSEIWRKGDEAGNAIPADAPWKTLYSKQADAIAVMARKSAQNAVPAEKVAHVLEYCLEANNPRPRTLVGRDAKIAAALRRFLPDSLFEVILRKALRV
jgi:NAD(P)-dependent dehydrogenase (short-subunit alcohol dehydrogenase family)